MKQISLTTRRLRVFSEGISVLDTGRVLSNVRSLGLENDSRSRQLARYVKEIGERYVDNLEVVMVYRSDRFLRGGDHTPLFTKRIRCSTTNRNE